MAQAKRTDAQWIVIDPTTLNDLPRAAYDVYKDAYKTARKAREDFETLMAESVEVPEGKRLVFGYNFGKLSVAVVDDDRKPAAKANVPQSLSSYLAGMTQKGR